MVNFVLKARIVERFGTQTVFARLVGLKEETVSRIIHGRQTAKECERQIIAKKLGLPESEIFSDFAEGQRSG